MQLFVEIVFLVSIGFVQFLKKSFNGKKSEQEQNHHKLPPDCTSILSNREAGQILSSPTAPMAMLDIVRRIGAMDFKLLDMPFGLPSLYVVTDYRSARKVLEDPASTKPAVINRFFYHTTHEGDNMIISDGHRWKHVRKSTMVAFSAKNVELMTHSITGIVDKFIEETLEPTIENGGGFDVLAEMNTITANVIIDVAFDYHFSKGEREDFLENLKVCWEEFGVKSGQNFFREFDSVRWMIPGVRKGRKAAKRMYEFCEKMATAYRKKDVKDKQPHKIIHLILEDEEYANDAERFRDMIGYVIAGFDTTANTIAFALRELAKTPKEQSKLREALQQCRSDEERRNCPQLKRVIREIFRMYPAAAFGSVRELGKDLVLPTKEVIPSGSWVNTAYYAIQRTAEVFENPDTFLPSRWETPTKAQMMSMLTFSYGRRNCQGQALANAEVTEVLAKLCGTYEFDIVEEGEATNIVLFKPVGTILSARKVGSNQCGLQ